MMLKNYYSKNHFWLDDGTTIKGIIEMNYQEWCDVYHFLQNEYKKAVKKIETYKRDSLNYALKQFDKKKPFSIGITGTYEIVKKYNLLNKYKNQNYAIKII